MTIGKLGDIDAFKVCLIAKLSPIGKQKMKEIRRTVSEELKLPAESLELSMGMSSDYKEAVDSFPSGLFGSRSSMVPP